MGGKGQRRREKNYLAAHGAASRLPPPPDPKQLDRLPSKLRALMSLTTSISKWTGKGSKDINGSKDIKQKNKRGDSEVVKKSDPEITKKTDPEITKKTGPEITKKIGQVITTMSEDIMSDDGNDDEQVMPPDDETTVDESLLNDEKEKEKKKKKRKRKQVQDLRFVKEMEADMGSKRRERKKKYWEAKKNKNKKAKTDENQDFPGHEKIRFGDVVEAPPKLSSVPKIRKTTVQPDASKERLRLQAIDAYRNRKGWTSRPGVQIPDPITL